MPVTEALSSRSDAFAPYKMTITPPADDFDFDGEGGGDFGRVSRRALAELQSLL
jgi:hypothetical protein